MTCGAPRMHACGCLVGAPCLLCTANTLAVPPVTPSSNSSSASPKSYGTIRGRPVFIWQRCCAHCLGAKGCRHHLTHAAATFVGQTSRGAPQAPPQGLPSYRRRAAQLGRCRVHAWHVYLVGSRAAYLNKGPLSSFLYTLANVLATCPHTQMSRMMRPLLASFRTTSCASLSRHPPSPLQLSMIIWQRASFTDFIIVSSSPQM